MLGGDLRGPAQHLVGSRRIGAEHAAAEDSERLAQQCRVLARSGARPLHRPHRGPTQPHSPRHVARAVGGVGIKHQGAGVVGPAGALDELLRDGPPASDHRGAGEPQAQLGVLVTAHQAQRRATHVQRLGGPPEQG
ncbi:MAG: hypothetical protein ACRDSI_02890 [Pseudonocardiaceae bacterium]